MGIFKSLFLGILISALTLGTERATAHAYLRWLQAHLQQQGRVNQAVLFVADGSYDTLPFWQGLPSGVNALVRSAKNRALSYLPPTPKHGNRKYGAKAPTPQDFWRQRSGWQFCQLTLRGHSRRLRYRIEGPFLRKGNPDVPLFLLIIGGETYTRHGKTKQRQPVPYLVNAVQDAAGHWVLPFPPRVLLFWAWQRWELEVVHRELKSNLGLGEKQCWHPQAALSTVAWSAWVYALLILTAYRTWGLTGDLALTPRGRRANDAGLSTPCCVRQCHTAVGADTRTLSPATALKKSPNGSIYITPCMVQPVCRSFCLSFGFCPLFSPLW